MDVSARPPDCDGQAADAVPTYKAKMEDAPKLLTAQMANIMVKQ